MVSLEVALPSGHPGGMNEVDVPLAAQVAVRNPMPGGKELVRRAAPGACKMRSFVVQAGKRKGLRIATDLAGRVLNANTDPVGPARVCLGWYSRHCRDCLLLTICYY